MKQANIKNIKTFASAPVSFIAQPDLAETQKKSWEWFIKRGLKELFEEVSPIRDYSGEKFELYFEDYHFDEPKYDERTARFRDESSEAPLRANVRLINLLTKEEKVQEVYLGNFPVMTERGTFIINGVERVVVSQLVRSPGVYFTSDEERDRRAFGAKVIPNRGGWLEFITDADGVLSVKIDKHRKAPATSLLRVFGLGSDDKIRKTFADIDTGNVKYIEKTLKKDSAHSAEESYSEIYKRLRPGDLATAENAKGLVDGMFFRPDRYSLSRVGRFKLNERLGFQQKKTSQLLDLEDIVAIVREIIRLNNDEDARQDDIDHFGNRRVRSVGELLLNRLYIGLVRLRRVIQDRMSASDIYAPSPLQLISSRPLMAVVREFFVSSQLSQFMEQVNALSELEHKRRLSSMGPGGLSIERAGFEVRDVHSSHYGRVCPIQTPEGQNIGLINYLANFARINEFGFLETPYLRVKNGNVTDETVWLNALDEEKYIIAQGGTELDAERKIVNQTVDARIGGEPGTCAQKEVELIDAATHQSVSVAASLVPFLEHDDAKRALMGANMQRQAVPSIKPSAPLVGTGMEEKTARDSGRVIIAHDEGEIISVDAEKIVLQTKNGRKIPFEIEKFKRSNYYTDLAGRPIVYKGQKVKKGDVLADSSSTENGVLAIGQNLLTAILSWEGANFEDAVILSDRVVQDDRFTSIHIEDFYCDVRDTKLGPEITTPDIPNISEERLRDLDEDGIVRIGAEVRSRDILVGKISPKGEVELTPEEKLLRAVFGEKAAEVKDTSLTLPHGKEGRVVGIKVFSRDRGDKLDPGVIKKVRIEIAQLRKVRAGDKLSGRHGNKGVISQIRPVEDMPYLEDGTPVDIILSPLGVPSRMNLGQILEAHLGMAASKLGYRAVTPVFVGATEEQIKSELKKAGLSETGKSTLYDGRSGKKFSMPVTVGYMYILKLNHLVEDKIHMRSTGPYSLITQQPLGGKAQFGGQRFGEMEVWALQGYGAAHTLQEMITIKSDDVAGRAAAYESIVRGEEIKNPSTPSAFKVLTGELKALGISVNEIYDEE